MRLRILAEFLSPSLLEALEQCGFRTDADLLFSASPEEIFQKLPQDASVTFRELKSCIALVAEKASARSSRADLWIQESKANQRPQHRLLSGVCMLDELVDGFGGPRVFEISGDKSSGKTALALQVSLNYLMSNLTSHIYWIDTTGDFSAERAVWTKEKLEGLTSSTALERLQVSRAFDIDVARDVLDMITSSLGLSSPSVGCIVIDTITALLGPTLSNISSQGHAGMITFMRRLRAIAQDYNMSILVINNSTSATPKNPESTFPTTVRKPALGPSFTYLTDLTLWLAKHPSNRPDSGAMTDSGELCVAEVFRSRMTRSKTWCTFLIRQGVLVSNPE